MEEQRLYGKKTEEEIIRYLNGKEFKTLDEHWKKIIRRMFPFVKDFDWVLAMHYPDPGAKPDMIIKIRHSQALISIKTGKIPSVHHEPFKNFYGFLKSLDVSNRTLKTIEFFHFGETEKINNNGKPFNKTELEERYGQYFLDACIELDNPNIIEAVIRRCVLKGAKMKRPAIDYLYYGDVEHGNLISREEIFSIIMAYREHGKSPIHFGGLNYMPSGRSRENKEYQFVKIKWPILSFLYYKNEEDVAKMTDGTFKS